MLVTDYQSAGRGRLGRTWTAPPGTSIAMSVLVRPDDVDPQRWTWLPLLTGLAVADGLERVAGLDVRLKWPNDVLVGDRKVCGILAERVETSDGPACVVGMGINTHLTVGRAAGARPPPRWPSSARPPVDRLRAGPASSPQCWWRSSCYFRRWVAAPDDSWLARRTGAVRPPSAEPSAS